MNEGEFAAHFHEIMEKVNKEIKENPLPPIIDEGMDDAVEKIIFSPDYVTRPMDPETIQSIKEMLVSQDARKNEDIDEWANKMLEDFDQYPLGD